MQYGTLGDLYHQVNNLLHQESPLLFAGNLPIHSETETEEASTSKWTIHVTYLGIRRSANISCTSTIRDLKRETRHLFPHERQFSFFLPTLRTHLGEQPKNELSLIECTSDGAEFLAEAAEDLAVAQVIDDGMNADRKAQLLKNFRSGAKSNSVEIVFSVDGSSPMMPCISQVISQLKETFWHLFAKIPALKIGLILHGDYFDQSVHSRHVVFKHCDLTDDVHTLCEFLSSACILQTRGACYELALRVAAERISWSESCSKALVVIGGSEPHPPSYTTEGINWFDELERLASKDIKVYGVRALDRKEVIPFYEEMAERTGAVSIQFSSFSLLEQMFLAICDAESTPSKEIEKKTGEGDRILGSDSEKAQTFLKSQEVWYDLRNDADYDPSFHFNRETDKWEHLGCNPPYWERPVCSFYHELTPYMKIVFVGDHNVGKTSMLLRIMNGTFPPEETVPRVFGNYSWDIRVDRTFVRVDLWDTDPAENDSSRLQSYQNAILFLVCFSVASPSSFESLPRWFDEIYSSSPSANVMVVGTKTDLRKEKKTLERLKELNHAPITQAQGHEAAERYNAIYTECSSLRGDAVDYLLHHGLRHTHGGPLTPDKKRRELFRRITGLFPWRQHHHC